ncbi:MAG: hypothetical protein A3A10_00330 [Candidatus Tagabacteria bacterium RIFCSPLOWO2_01_FULL_42_9]|uniref:Uncharacterized protein n=1 Tax=Candidatus Tagabacteria bacterium RIFCSPLOWO2_01_FULL_42_9 TaxID=1802296 RepID=A0A1G2LXB9_9BACT|nr:MAG: hypothetical protein A3A10_00330 [Candidatus Tagabacteria bacterium RIFCSPLOWO2_01_FULL_42_9]
MPGIRLFSRKPILAKDYHLPCGKILLNSKSYPTTIIMKIIIKTKPRRLITGGVLFSSCFYGQSPLA